MIIEKRKHYPQSQIYIDKMKNIKLDKYEQEIEDSFTSGDFHEVENQQKKIEEAIAAAKSYLTKKKIKPSSPPTPA